MIPQRIQRKRTKGFRLPPNTVCVTRGTKWGNPWKVGHRLRDLATGNEFTIDQKMAVEMYRNMITRGKGKAAVKLMIQTELRGKNLACYCRPGTPCHADVLLKIANA